MRIAKQGFEAEYENFKAKKLALAEEKETVKAEVCAKVDADFVERESILDEILDKLSIEIPDSVEEVELVTENEKTFTVTDEPNSMPNFPHIVV